MRTERWLGTVAIAASVALTLIAGHPARAVTITGGNREQRAMAHWAEARFEAAGLSLPRLEIQFHIDPGGCHERSGYYADSVASICSTRATPMARRTLLHEMAHGWINSNVSGAERTRFLELRGLRTWSDPTVAWAERGFEHAAEIMAWALDDQGTGILAPSIPDNALEQLADGYECLTGHHLPSLPSET